METDMFSQLCDYMSEVGDLASIPVYVKMWRRCTYLFNYNQNA